jgi:hypothetical protein
MLKLLLFFVVATSIARANVVECRAVLSKGPWYNKIDFGVVEEVLSTLPVVKFVHLHDALAEMGKKPSGTTLGIRLLVFEDRTKAVWKPDGRQTEGEVGAYQAAKLVGYRLIPPTVARSIGDLTGSIQYFVDSPVDLLALTRQQREQLWTKVSVKEKSERDIFNFVFGQWDRHWGNVLVDEARSLIAIDNGAVRSRQMVRFGELPFIARLPFKGEAAKKAAGTDWGSFPFNQSILLERPTKEAFTEIVGQYVDSMSIDRFWKERTDTTMRIVIWDNHVWIQAIGFGNYGPILPMSFPKETMQAYRKLTYENLRTALPFPAFSDKQIFEILERRDQILEAAKK